MSNSNKIVQSFWNGGSFTKMELLCMKSFLANGHEFHLYSYENLQNLPEGVLLKDACEVLPKELLFLDSYNLVAAFSDWFRWKLIHDKGGWWVDMDVVCLKYFEFEDEYCFATERNTMGTGRDGIASAIFKAPREAEFLVDILDRIDKILITKRDIIWGEFGPPLLNEIVSEYDSSTFIQSPDVFCPLNWYDTSQFVSNVGYTPPEESVCIHLWNRLWGKLNIEKNGNFPLESAYEYYKRLYGV